jgi:hypothetical protein
MTTPEYTQRYLLHFFREGPTTDRSVDLLVGPEGPKAMQLLLRRGVAAFVPGEDGRLAHWLITDSGRDELRSLEGRPRMTGMGDPCEPGATSR